MTARVRVSLAPDLAKRLRSMPKRAGETGAWNDRLDAAVREYLADGAGDLAKAHEMVAELREDRQELWTRCQTAAKTFEGPHIPGCICQFCETVRMLRAALPDRSGPARRSVQT